ncbi:hypothetical protein DERP_005234 [Dermatophagoides pteronyssinus]|uniref:RAB11-binding protein RELCH homolog n=2 Tax=Dermatophagoides pteronyssinus TaxID=6956 RepID=A0A6P6Y8E8_DERPT|nr:RAB11-binding protein RELCH homolog [Dermatophagoides pteronyssinus]KAH9423654.1 hypothetical protein DERP_005234 [Dermatophagoides pteronyssinus]
METQEELTMTTSSTKSNVVVDNPNESTKESELSNIDSEMEIFDRIASKLLRSGFLLTALELHAELVERGKESSRLRDYFDNPQNFEKHFDISPTNRPSTSNETMTTTMFPKKISIERSPSENTFDSLDSTHYSDEDIERHIGDERIAVLEFELRKARQTIDSLRASLTMTTTGQCSDMVDNGGNNNKLPLNECEPPNNNDDLFINESKFNEYSNNEFSRDFYYRGSADGDSCPGEDDKFSKKSTNLSYESGTGGGGNTIIKPHEKRALNYLINEYLMAHNYKITSITFCDENTDQDFDNWNDVGLNIQRPPDLLRIYRQFWNNINHQVRQQSSSSGSYLMRTNSNATTIVSNSHKTIINDDDDEFLVKN